MPAYTAYELTLIIELTVLDKSKQERANIVIPVFMQAYICILTFTWVGLEQVLTFSIT